MNELRKIFTEARDNADGARAYKEILQSRDLSDGQKEQLALLAGIAKKLSGGGVNVALDFSETGMAIVMTEANVSVRVPFTFSQDGFSGSAAIQPELGIRSLEAANTRTNEFALQFDAKKFVAALAQEMTLRGISAMQSAAAKSHMDGRKPGTP
jgi:hypothetical protein